MMGDFVVELSLFMTRRKATRVVSYHFDADPDEENAEPAIPEECGTSGPPKKGGTKGPMPWKPTSLSAACKTDRMSR
eukprot:5988398-Amphidinium_carterae.1